MPIEFLCTQCGKMLRVPDGSAGKQAKCPQCGAVLPIPSEAAAPAGAISPPPPPLAPAPRPLDMANPYQSPAVPVPERAVAGGELTPTLIDMGDVMSRTWAIYKANWLSATAVVVLVMMASGVVFGLIALLSAAVSQDENAQKLISTPVFLVLGVVVGVGVLSYFIKLARGEPAEVSDLASGTRLFASAAGVGILSWIAVTIGTILFIIPGIIAQLMFSQSFAFVADRQLGAVDAMRASMQFTRGNKLTLFAMNLVVGIGGSILGCATCGLGFLVLYPYMAILMAVTYLTMTGQPTAEQIGQPEA